MKTFIFLLGILILTIPESFPQNINSLYNNDLSFKNKSSLPVINTDDESESFDYFLSYGIAPNEVLFNKDFDNSFNSSTSHNIDLGFAIINRGRKLSMEFIFSAFYQFSNQKNTGTAGFETGYNGFGVKAPEIALIYNLGNIGLKLYYPVPLDFGWFRFSNYIYPVPLGESEKYFLEYYNDKFKFSSARELGLGLNIGKNFSLNLGYEGRLFHPSYKFLQQATGNLMELSVFTISYLISYSLFMSADIYSGLFFLLLPEAATFGMLELKKNSVNWPFDSEAPLYYNSLKISANVYF